MGREMLWRLVPMGIEVPPGDVEAHEKGGVGSPEFYVLYMMTPSRVALHVSSRTMRNARTSKRHGKCAKTWTCFRDLGLKER